MTRRVVLAVNPQAGGGRATAAGAVADQRLRARELDVVPVHGDTAQAQAAGVRQALADGAEALVVVGGDGAVHLAVNLVAGTGCPLGIVPAGTGNDVARALGLRLRDPAAAADDVAEAIWSGRSRTVDAVRRLPDTPPADEVDTAARWFAGVLGAGFDALVNERANGWRWPRGHLRYDLAILRELPVLRPREYHLDLDGESWTVPAVMVVVANTPSYGGGMRICPRARLDDGLLDVLVVAPLSRAAFLRIYPRVYAGRHLGDPRVTVRRARRVSVRAPGIVAYADGERWGPLPLTVEVVPGALRVLGPPTTNGPS
ncbi:MAG TPA: diacylglycerol kinase family protein [Kineosporiaceae bacterium]